MDLYVFVPDSGLMDEHINIKYIKQSYGAKP